MNLYCSFCKQDKPIDRFSKKKTSKTGYSSNCKDCHNEYMRTVWYPANKEKQMKSSRLWKNKNPLRVLAQRYKLPVETVELILRRANGSCEICGSTKNLHFDHCHNTSNPRGVLCCKCNTLLGKLGDDYDSVFNSTQSFLSYLSRDFIS